eukprot:325521-Chlamydomonas_euryale.AAC.2
MPSCVPTVLGTPPCMLPTTSTPHPPVNHFSSTLQFHTCAGHQADAAVWRTGAVKGLPRPHPFGG